MAQRLPVTFGFPAEWEAFGQRHPRFLAGFSNLKTLLELTFLRSFTSHSIADRTIFYLGRLAVEDFMEILLLCGNGYGHGARKLLRSLFERAVTAEYLRLHPEEAEAFAEFGWVNHHRLLMELRNTFTDIELDSALVADVEANYERVKDRFKVPLCETCGTTRLNHSWTRMDMVSMARAAGEDRFRVLVVNGYRLPLLEAHPTLQGIQVRLEENPEGFGFADALQRGRADEVLNVAHHLLLLAVETQQQYFELTDFSAAITACLGDFQAIWSAAA